MKGEIIRRISVEITKDKRVTRDKSVTKNDIDSDEDDYLVKTIGGFGLWQAIVSVTGLLTRFIAVWNITSMYFLTPVSEFVCVEFSDNTTTEVINSTCYGNCLKYKYSSLIEKSIIKDFELICENSWLANFAHSILMLGILVGASLFGWISDRYGRRTALLYSTFLNVVFMIALPFSPSYIIFTSIRFVIGIASGGSLMICLVYAMEICGRPQRDITAACTAIPDGLAQTSLAGFAYFTSNWQMFTFSYGVASCLILVLTLFVPESPRWLVSQGRGDEAIQVITSAANRNKLDTSNIKAEITITLEKMKLIDSEIVKTSYLDFFKSKALFMPTFIIFMIWVILGTCFYGINQYVTIIGTDLYLTVVVLGLIQFPVCLLSIIVNQRCGRRMSTIGTTTGTAILMLIVYFFPKGYWLTTMFGILAFVFCSITFIVAYIYVSELYPTPLRNMSYGLTSGGAKIGAMVAPFIASLSPRWLPSLIFCIFSIVGGLFYLLLPETKGQNLKDTIKK